MASPMTRTRNWRKRLTRSTAVVIFHESFSTYLLTGNDQRVLVSCFQIPPCVRAIGQVGSQPQVLDCAYNAQGVRCVASDEIGAAQRLRRQGLSTQINQTTATPGTMPGLDIVEHMTDEPRTHNVKIQSGGVCKQDPGRELAALTTKSPPLDD